MRRNEFLGQFVADNRFYLKSKHLKGRLERRPLTICGRDMYKSQVRQINLLLMSDSLRSDPQYPYNCLLIPLLFEANKLVLHANIQLMLCNQFVVRSPALLQVFAFQIYKSKQIYYVHVGQFYIQTNIFFPCWIVCCQIPPPYLCFSDATPGNLLYCPHI